VIPECIGRGSEIIERPIDDSRRKYIEKGGVSKILNESMTMISTTIGEQSWIETEVLYIPPSK
jgi:hypothetical protein